MELICLIKCLTELAFGVQRDFRQDGRDGICSERKEAWKMGLWREIERRRQQEEDEETERSLLAHSVASL